MTTAKVGSAPWLRAERASIGKLCAQDTEDFVFSARQDVEWLNEHMAELFALSSGLGGKGGKTDLAELLKTPRAVVASGGKMGRRRRVVSGMKGKGKGRVAGGKIVKDIFAANLSTTSLATAGSSDDTKIGATVRTLPVMPPPPVPNKATDAERPKAVNGEADDHFSSVHTHEANERDTDAMSISVASQVNGEEDILSQPSQQQRSHAHPPRLSKAESTFRDSGNWSQSSGMPSQQHQKIMAKPRSPRKVVEGPVVVNHGEDSIVSLTEEQTQEDEASDGGVGIQEEAVEQGVEADVEEAAIGDVSFGTRHSSPFVENVESLEQDKAEVKEEHKAEVFHTQKGDDEGRFGAQEMAVEKQIVSPPALAESRRSSARNKGRDGLNATVKTVGAASSSPHIRETASRKNSAVTPSASQENISTPSPMSTSRESKKISTVAPVEKQVTPSPVKPVTAVSVDTMPPAATRSPAVATPDPEDQDSPPSNLDEPSPVPTFIRKSSLSFASLPPREPIGGGRVSTTSMTTTETVRLNGMPRSSWLAGRRTLGRSLGGRLTMGDAVIGEDGEEGSPQPAVTPAPGERKRSRGGETKEVTAESQEPSQTQAAREDEPVVEQRERRSVRKRSRGASYKGAAEELPAAVEQGKDEAGEQKQEAKKADNENEDGSTKLIAEHNKWASQRLQERIMQLGKLGASVARNTAATNATAAAVSTVSATTTPVEQTESPVYPDLTAHKPASQSNPSASTTRHIREPSATDDEWIPPVRPLSTRPGATRPLAGTPSGLFRSQTLPSRGTPQKNPARGYLPRHPAYNDDAGKEDPDDESVFRPKTPRRAGEEENDATPKASHYPQSLSFNAINTPLPQGQPSPVRAMANSFSALLPTGSPKKNTPLKKSSSTSEVSSAARRFRPAPAGEQEPISSPLKPVDGVITQQKSQTFSAFQRAKEMFLQSNGTEAAANKTWQKGSSPAVDVEVPRTPQGGGRQHEDPRLYPDLSANSQGSSGGGSKRQTRGSRSKEMLQKQQEEEAEAERRKMEVQKLQAEEEERQRLLEEQRLEEERRLEEEKKAEERKVKLEEKRQEELQRREKELQRRLAEGKRAAEEEATRQEQEKEEVKKREETERFRKQKELLAQREEELRRLKEENRAIRLREEERLRRVKEEELKAWQEAADRARIEDEERIRKEEEEEERRKAEEARLDELRRRQEEDIRRQQEAAEKRRTQKEVTPVPALASGSDSEDNVTRGVARPKSAMAAGRPPSRIQPPSGGKRPLRQPGPKPDPRQKPVPVSIQVGTASQRAAMDRQKSSQPTPSSTLLSAMERSFSAAPARPPSAEPSLHSSISAPQLKKSNSTNSVASQARMKGLETAANAKKPVTTAEMERKREEHRKAIEARREEIRRKEALLEEEKRKATLAASQSQGRRTVEKDLAPQKTVPKSLGLKAQTSASKLMGRIQPTLPMVEVQPPRLENKVTPDAETINIKVPKRAYQPDEDSTPVPSTTVAAPTASVFGNRLAPPKQPESKKRKTDDWDQQFEQALAGSSQPSGGVGRAVRPSATKRDWPSKSTYVLPPSSTAATGAGMATGTIRAVMEPTVKLTGGAKSNSGDGGVDGIVKYSNDKIRFANEGPAATSTTTTTTTTIPTATTPGPSSLSNTHKTPKTSNGSTSTSTTTNTAKKSALKTPNNPSAAASSSKDKKRVYTPMAGDGIELPDIPTDSESDSDSDSDGSNSSAKSGKFPVPQWAESPELRQALYAQQTMDPEAVFGPMAPLHMDEIFRSRSGRFRARTSSANWSGADRLTAEEIEADAEARRKMMDAGGWVYGGI